MINNSGQVSGAILRGVDPESAGAVVTFKSMIKDGSITSLGKKIDGIPPIIIGGELAKQIGAHPGNVITVISPEG